jgi:L-threonylcarbamoyladenylate synthase
MVCTSPLRLRLAARRLRQSGLVAYPTEAVWGLGCDPLDAAAVDALLALKGRPASKGFILIAADLGQLEPFLDIASAGLRERLSASWPGPVTWIVPASRRAPPWLAGRRGTLAVRVTAHPVAAALCREFGGAVVSTSANRSGTRPARSLSEVRRHFPGACLGFLPGPLGGLGRPTAIFDARSGARMR